jgi:hypothetical protein
VSGTVAVNANAADSDGTVASVQFFAGATSLGTDNTAPYTVNWNTTTASNGAVALTARATDNDGAVTTSAVVNVTVNNGGTGGAGEILFVVGNPAALTAGDVAVRDQLLSKGHTVTLADDNAATVGDATGKDLILISSSSSSGVLKDNLAAANVTILVAKPWLMDDYGLTASHPTNYGNRSGASLAITNPGHPTAAGLNGNVAFAIGSTNFTWGIAPASATVVATLGADASIYQIEAGDTLANGQVAPACRMTFPVFNDEPVAYNATAWNLFHASIDWGIANCESP